MGLYHLAKKLNISGPITQEHIPTTQDMSIVTLNYVATKIPLSIMSGAQKHHKVAQITALMSS